MLRTVILLVVSNIFMTLAWYGHLKWFKPSTALWLVVLVSWGLAFFEYCFQVPANRIGHLHASATQLKILQEAISLTVFVPIVFLLLGERLRWNHACAFVLILAAVALAFLPSRTP